MQPTESYDFLIEAKKLATLTLDEIRYSVATLRNESIEKKSITTLINLLLREFFQRTGIFPQYDISLNSPLPEEIKITLYRILQEALTNVAKHSEAEAVNVKLQAFPEYLHVFIEDNGQGFDPQQNTTGFGIQGMYERVAALGGDLLITSKADCGCSIAINIPYQPLKL